MNHKPHGQPRASGWEAGILAFRPTGAGHPQANHLPGRFDADKVERVRAALDDGSYRIDAAKIAKRLLSD